MAGTAKRTMSKDSAEGAAPYVSGLNGSEAETPGMEPTQLQTLLREMDDPSQWGDVEEVGPGFYRAPEVGRQLAAAIAVYRKEHGLTQEQLGRTLLLHQSQVARLEAGQHTPQLETLVRLARHLNLTLAVTVTPAGTSLAVGAGVDT